MPESFQGIIGTTYDDSKSWWPPLSGAPANAPNVVVVLLDDVGYAQLGCYGSDIATPTFDRLAATGLRYANYHTTALCSPTRACLLTGRNHHSNGMARVVELAAGISWLQRNGCRRRTAFSPRSCARRATATFAVGKWHLAPATEMSAGSPRDKWPLGRGFDRYYGFLGGETDQYHPELVRDNHPVDPPRTPEEEYHLSEDLADNAVRFLADLRGASETQPLFVVVRAGRVPRSPPGSAGRTSSAIADTLTRVGTSGARKSSHANSPRAYCPPARNSPNAPRGYPSGRHSAPTSSVSRHD